MKIAIIARSNKRRRNGEYGCCVAGITENGGWIRLVADESGDSLPDDDATPSIDTVIDANVNPVPCACQPENAVLCDWRRINENISSYIELLKLPTEEYLFVNASNRLTEEDMNALHGSLGFFEISDLEIYKNENGKWKARFKYNGNRYGDIAMTDPKYYSIGFIGDADVVISLPNSAAGFSGYYKFIARIRPRRH